MSFDPKVGLLVALGIFGIFFLVVLVRGNLAARRERSGESPNPSIASTVVGFVTNFFDTLGIGSFATSTAIFRQFRMVRDEHIPGTLNAGHTLPTFAQAIIFTTAVMVDPTTLILMIVAAVLGAWMGAGFVASWPRRKIQMGMAIALLAAAGIMVFRMTLGDPAGEDAIGLRGGLLIAGLIGNFALGALMTLGIGLYAPCMILVSMLGMSPTTAFPIMMGSCAFLMPVASAKFIQERAYHPGVTLGLLIGGIPASLIAGLIVKSLPLTAVKWLVVVVVIYASIGLLRSALQSRNADDAKGDPIP
jgi:uncharacterized membrane protein YfcA